MGKLKKQKFKFEKSLVESKAELDNANKQIEYLKSQATIIYGQKAKQVEEELKKIVATNKMLNDDNTKLLLIVKGFKKTLVEQIGEKLVILS